MQAPNAREYDAWTKEGNKYKLESNMKFTFVITYILLLTTGTVTLIEALRTDNPTIRHIMNLETAISLIAGYFYSVFYDRIQKAEDGLADPMTWLEMSQMRYLDWSITTPIMLTVILMVLSFSYKEKVEFRVWLPVILMNYAMLGIGYAGEVGMLQKGLADFLGFIPFIGMFGLIYTKYIAPKYFFNNYLIFFLYLGVWTLYGVFYMLDMVSKNTAYNVLDLISKCFVGLGLWVLFTRIMKE